MKSWKWIALAAALTGLLPRIASAGPNENAKIVIHLATPTTKNACTRAEAQPSCASIVTAGDLSQGYFAYVLVVDADSATGIAGVQFGIEYDQAENTGVDIFGWTKCTTLEFAMEGWPEAGTGTLLTWDSSTVCQRSKPGGSGSGVVAVAGYFYCAAYGADTLEIIPRPADGLASIASCIAEEDTLESPSLQRDPSPLGFAVFTDGAEAPGYNPCGTGGDNNGGEGVDDGEEGSDDSASDNTGGGGQGEGSGDSGPGLTDLWTQNFNGTYSLNDSLLQVILDAAPMEFDSDPSTVTLTIPMPDGSYPEYRVFESPILSDSLALEYPDFRTFIAQGLDDPTATARLDWSSAGFHALVLAINGTFFVQPNLPVNGYEYLSIENQDFVQPLAAQSCLTDSVIALSEHSLSGLVSTGDSLLTIYHWAINAAGEYTQYIGSTTAALYLVLSTANRASAVLEREVGVRLILVHAVAYADPNSDPFDGLDAAANQLALDSTIGNENYDIGHLFQYGSEDLGTGFAAGRVCEDHLKGAAYSTDSNPWGATFLSTVVHETGHQLGASRHTSNEPTPLPPLVSCSCTGLGVEIYSGSTIMMIGTECGNNVHSGICNVEDTNDMYFHADSYALIRAWRDNPAGGATCGSRMSTGNAPPQVDAGSDYVIPSLTPFVLTSNLGVDSNDDKLTYCWESMDNEFMSNPNKRQPLYRSRPPVRDRSRAFPLLEDLLAGVATPYEILPPDGRSVRFMVTVRDNHAGHGGVATDDILVTASGPPFAVTSPDSSIVMQAGQPLTINWTIGGGTVASEVDIILLDNGKYASMLAQGVANDGQEQVILPSIQTYQARILVRAVGNIFFDVSDIDFIITIPASVPDKYVHGEYAVHISANPFTNYTEIMLSPSVYEVLERGDASIYICDIAGRLVKSVLSRGGEVRDGALSWNGKDDEGKDVGSGIYFFVVRSGDTKVVSRKIVRVI